MGYTPLQIPEQGLYLVVDGQKLGPLTFEEVKAKFEQGEINRGNLLWYSGLVNWVTVGDVPDFNRRGPLEPPDAVEAPDENQFWIFDSAEVKGLTKEALQEAIHLGRFRRADLVYHQEQSSWVRADQHPEFTALFPAADLPKEASPLEAAPEASPSPSPEAPELVSIAVERPLPTPVPSPEPAKPTPGLVGNPPLATGDGKAIAGGSALKNITNLKLGGRAKPPPLLNRARGATKTGGGLGAVFFVLILLVMAAGAFSYSIGGWNLNMVMAWFFYPPASENRAPTSVPSSSAPTTPRKIPQRLGLYFALGTKLEDLRLKEAFKRCQMIQPNSTWQCDHLVKGMASLNFSVRDGYVYRITAWFTLDLDGEQLYQSIGKVYGAPAEVKNLLWSELSNEEREKLGNPYRSKTLFQTAWKEEAAVGHSLTVREFDKQHPLELTVELIP